MTPMWKYLLTFGITITATIVIVLSVGNPQTIPYRLTYNILPAIVAGLGLFWRRRPVLGYWLLFAALILFRTVGRLSEI